MRMAERIRGLAGCVTFLLVAAGISPAPAQTDFYKAKTVDLYIGYSAGGGYDVYGRLVARHMSKHLPGNPVIVPKNMAGAGSLRLTNWLYNVAPKDGTAFGIIGRGLAFDPMFGTGGAQFEATKFSWIGSANDEVSLCVAVRSSGITRFEQLYTKELIIGGTGATADTDLFPRVLNGVLGTKFKLITGYPGGNDVILALQRGEVHGRCGWSWSTIKATHKNLIDDGTVALLVQLSLGKHPELPDIPLVTEFVRDEEQGQILRLIFARQVMGRPFLAPPGLPGERLALLRRAFMATMRDAEFLAEAERAQIEITPVSGEDVEKLVREIYATPPAAVQKAAAAVR